MNIMNDSDPLQLPFRKGESRTIRQVCVFCGSNAGSDPRYRRAAVELVELLVARGWGLVYGGGRVGLMGVLADAMLAAGGEVTGVIPEMLATRELLHTGVTRMHVVASMHARKALMAELADAFLALPGGYGTFEELLETITWGQLGLHAKPVGVLNVRGFFDPLIVLVEHAIAEGFIAPEQRGLFVSDAEPAHLIERLACHQPPVVSKWIKAADL